MIKRILICDDDENILEATKIILSDKGYEVEAAKSGEEACKKLKEKEFDVLLLDLWMPTLDGKETTKFLKSQEKTKNLPIIIFSASSQIEKITREIGADGYLKKPFDILELEKIIEEHA